MEILRSRPVASLSAEHDDTSLTLVTLSQQEVLQIIEAKLPQQEFYKVVIDFGEEICTVCMDKYVLPSFKCHDLVRKTKCKHVLHSTCIDEWFLTYCRMLKCPT